MVTRLASPLTLVLAVHPAVSVGETLNTAALVARMPTDFAVLQQAARSLRLWLRRRLQVRAQHHLLGHSLPGCHPLPAHRRRWRDPLL
ncbi:hypothetical protein IWX50DRAFT_624316 [Phyllosticta citricarpa]